MKEIYITITGTDYRFGNAFLEKGQKVKLVKEPDNEFDKEAIAVEVKPIGKIGYVANSYKTVIGECYSAGRLYDKIEDTATAIIEMVIPKGAIALVVTDDASDKKSGKKSKKKK